MDLIKENRKIYFDERLHKYTDELGNPYVSMTTIIGKYVNEFNTDKMAKICAAIGRNPTHPKYSRYKGLTEIDLKRKWKKEKDDACENGSNKHDFLEKAVKTANGYDLVSDTYINGRIYTVLDIIDNPEFGYVDINWFVTTGIAKRYPKIFNDLLILINNGFRLYAEIGVFNPITLSSGLIDLLAIKNNNIIIIDWKTNKADIKFEAGYYEKDDNNELTNVFVFTDKWMKYPLTMLPDSIGNHYGLQLNGYGWHCIQFGLNYLGSILYQIRENKDGGIEKVDKLPIPNMINYADMMIKHHSDNLNRKTQTRLFV